MFIRSIKIFPIPRKVQMSAKKRTRYYKRSKNLPKKVIEGLQKGMYVFSPTGYVLIKGSKVKLAIPRNKGSETTGTTLSINGQLLYNGMVNPITRAKYITKIKELIRPFLINQQPIDPGYFPITLSAKLHVFIENGTNWDVDNLWLYGKCIQDLMVELRMIPDDNVKYISGSMGIKVIMWSKNVTDDPYAPDSEGMEIFIESDTTNVLLRNIHGSGGNQPQK